jgi:ribose transport system ATP-binding protein
MATLAESTPQQAPGKVLAGLYGVNKYYTGVHAAKDIEIEFESGKVHCLLGENGAGKSTVIKMLAGAIQPDTGHIELNGRRVSLKSPHDAMVQGVSTVFQELTLVPEMTVAENIWLGREHTVWGAVLNRREREKKTAELLEDLGIEDISPRAAIKNLGVAHQQLVEIAKAAVGSHSDGVMIMDEPTATLTTRETETLFELIRRLKARGCAIIYITHRLEELDVIGDVATVMRDGAIVDTFPIAGLDRHALIEMMIGRKLGDLFPERQAEIGEQGFSVPDLVARDGSGPLFVRRGEVVGLFGLVGAGRSEMVRAITGADKLSRISVDLDGQSFTFHAPSQALGAGLAVVPEDRKSDGILPEMSVADNITISALNSVSNGPILSPRRVKSVGRSYVEELRIRTPTIDQLIVRLSGGNQQKCLIARVLAAGPKFVIFDEPTRGIDVGARTEVYRLINELCANGIGVLMISSDLHEAIGMSDRIYVMKEQELIGVLPAAEVTESALMKMALGEGVK